MVGNPIKSRLEKLVIHNMNILLVVRARVVFLESGMLQKDYMNAVCWRSNTEIH